MPEQLVRVTRTAVAAVGALDAVAAMLRKELAVKRLGALENPATPFDVELSVDGATLAARIRALLEGGTGSDQGGAHAWATSAVVYEVAPD